MWSRPHVLPPLVPNAAFQLSHILRGPTISGVHRSAITTTRSAFSSSASQFQFRCISALKRLSSSVVFMRVTSPVGMHTLCSVGGLEFGGKNGVKRRARAEVGLPIEPAHWREFSGFNVRKQPGERIFSPDCFRFEYSHCC